MRVTGLLVVAVGVLLVAASRAPSVTPPPEQRLSSRYLALESDREVAGRVTLLSTSLALKRAATVLLHSDGAFAPRTLDAAAKVYVNVDGRQISNESSIDWRGSAVPVRHSFNVVGALGLGVGTHKVELIGEAVAGRFSVGRSSNLSVFVGPARSAATTRLGAVAGPFDFTSLDLQGNHLPHVSLVSLTADAREPSVALASAATRVAGHDGDSMLGIYLDGRHPVLKSLFRP